MADKGHVKKLKEGVDAWNIWRRENPKIKPDLSKAELNGEELSGIDLSETNLSEANLHNAYLSGANLENANLSHANLNHATLNAAKLNHANMSVCNLDYAHLENADLNSSSLSYASLEQAYLLRANLYRANLSNAKLSSAYLSRANLNNANMSLSKLEKANLSYAQLVNADLSGAVLIAADMSEANLTGARLHNIDMKNVNLSFANLRRASLENADFEGAYFCNTVLVDVNLGAVNNLDTCQHRASSFVDFQTLQQSGELSVIFLNGCGLPKKLIDSWPDILHQAISYYSCHICFSEKDKRFAFRLMEQLQQSGIRCWADERKKYAGETVLVKVNRVIKPWEKVLLCCSEASLGSDWLDSEVDGLLKKSDSSTLHAPLDDTVLLPLNLDAQLTSGYWVSGKSHLLKARMVADFDGWEGNEAIFNTAVETLLAALKRS